jgi:hypothetical protein
MTHDHKSDLWKVFPEKEGISIERDLQKGQHPDGR